MTSRIELATILKTTEKNLDRRIVAMKLGPVCGRCGGCGRYSFNGSHSRCYGCNGAGHLLPRGADQFEAVCARAVEAANDGTLQAYLDRCLACSQSKDGSKRAFAAWHKMDALNGYSANWRNLDTLQNRDQVVARNKVGVDLIKNLNRLYKFEKTDWVEYHRVLSDGIEALENITAELEREKNN